MRYQNIVFTKLVIGIYAVLWWKYYCFKTVLCACTYIYNNHKYPTRLFMLL